MPLKDKYLLIIVTYYMHAFRPKCYGLGFNITQSSSLNRILIGFGGRTYMGLDPHRSSSKLYFARMRSLRARNSVKTVILGSKLIQFQKQVAIFRDQTIDLEYGK